MGWPEKGVEREFIKAWNPEVPLPAVSSTGGTAPSQEDAFLWPLSTHMLISRDWRQPSSNHSANLPDQTQQDHSWDHFPRARVKHHFLCF